MLERLHGQERLEALKLFDLMTSKGLAPNAQIYIVIIYVVCKETWIWPLLYILGIQVAALLVATQACQPALPCLPALVMQGQMNQVLSLQRQIEEAGPVHDSSTYNTVIKLLTTEFWILKQGLAHVDLSDQHKVKTSSTHDETWKEKLNHVPSCKVHLIALVHSLE